MENIVERLNKIVTISANYRDIKFMKYIVLTAILLVYTAPMYSMDFYVSPLGDDQSQGTLANPFRTLPRAVNAVRSWRTSGGVGSATIVLRHGRHQLSETLVLGIEDGAPSAGEAEGLDTPGSGSVKSPAYLTFAAYPGESPIISAGIPITGWQLLQSPPSELPTAAVGKVWVADIPENLDNFKTLYNAKGRLNRAIGNGFNPTGKGDKKTLHFPSGALKNWSNLQDVEILVRPRNPWTINMLPLESVDEGSGMAKTAVSATYDMSPLVNWAHNPLGVSVWVENVLEVLDQPGEWVANTVTGKIYLWPSNPAADGSPQEILAPSTSELIRVEGNIDYDGPTDIPVRGITFRGLTFTHGDRRGWNTDVDRLGWGLQHDWEMFDRPTALLRFRGAEECRVIQCRFENSGGTGVRLDLHAQRNQILDCEFTHLGEAGILLAGYGTGSKDANRNNDILNNHIHDFGEIIWHAAGIWAWQSGYNHIANNYLHHSAYSAILITNRILPDRDIDGEGGRTVRRSEISAEVLNNVVRSYDYWLTLEKYLHSRHNLVEYNEISHSVQKLSDGNGIYVSGAGTGNIIRYNYLHDNDAVTVTETIRCDDDQHHTLIFGNIIEQSNGFSVIASKGVNDIINNFIVLPSGSPTRGYISFERYRVTGSVVKHNIIVAHNNGGKPYGTALLTGTPDGTPRLEDTDMDSNLYFHPNNPTWADGHLQKMREYGLEQASRFADPMFVDYQGGNYLFKAGSPAPALGIKPLDVSLMGRQEDFTVGTVTKY